MMEMSNILTHGNNNTYNLLFQGAEIGIGNILTYGSNNTYNFIKPNSESPKRKENKIIKFIKVFSEAIKVFSEAIKVWETIKKWFVMS